MTFITGSITNANPGPALYAAIETAMLADGWTLADTVVIGSNTHKVLKSAAAGNAQNLDWYLDINYPTTGITGGIRFAAFEGYNPTTKLAVNGPYIASNATIDPTTYSRFGTTGSALETNWANTAGNGGFSNTLTASAFTYWVSVTRNRIIVMLSNAPSDLGYSGFFTPTSAHATNAGAALFPLVSGRLTVSSSTTNPNSTPTGNVGGATSLSRLPKTTVVNWSSHCSIWAGPPIASTLGSGTIGTAGLSPSPLTGETTLTPAVVLGGAAALSATGTSPSAFIGTLLDVTGASVSTGSIRGDSVTVGSDTWYMCANSSGYILLFRAV